MHTQTERIMPVVTLTQLHVPEWSWLALFVDHLGTHGLKYAVLRAKKQGIPVSWVIWAMRHVQEAKDEVAFERLCRDAERAAAEYARVAEPIFTRCVLARA